MDIIASIIQIALFIIAAKIFEDVWKNRKEILLNKRINISLIVIGTILCVSLNLFVNNLLPFLNDSISVNENTQGLFNLIFAIVTGIILAPVLEETLYRYFLYEKIKTKLNITISVILTSVIFGLIHFYELAGTISSIVLGLILQLIYIKTKNLLTVILIHMLCNLGLILFILPKLEVNVLSLSIFGTVSLISLILLIVKLFQKNDKTINF